MSYEEIKSAFQEMLDDGNHCSQCVFKYWAERLGIDDEFSMRISSGLGMGVNHGDSCGAVTSTALAFGLVYGFSDGAEHGADDGVEERVKDFEAAFAERNGSLMCRDLLSGGYDAADPEATVPGGVNPWENCAKYCADAVELAEVHLSAADLELASKDFASAITHGEDAPSPYVVAAGSGVAGLALGVLAAAVFTYEKRRAENERGCS